VVRKSQSGYKSPVSIRTPGLSYRGQGQKITGFMGQIHWIYGPSTDDHSVCRQGEMIAGFVGLGQKITGYISQGQMITGTVGQEQRITGYGGHEQRITWTVGNGQKITGYMGQDQKITWYVVQEQSNTGSIGQGQMNIGYMASQSHKPQAGYSHEEEVCLVEAIKEVSITTKADCKIANLINLQAIGAFG